MPLQVTLDRGLPGQPAPLEGADESTTAGVEAAAHGALMSSLGGTGIAKLLEATAPGVKIPHDEAVRALKDQNYDPAGVPTEGMSAEALRVEMNRQSNIAIDRNIADRAHLSGTTRFVAGLAGGFADPVNLALLPVGGGLASAGAGVGGRLAVGAAVGAAYAGGADVAENALTGHSDDDLSLASLRDVLWGGAIGGGLHATFGGKAPKVEAPRIEPGPMTMAGIDTLERSGAAARQQGVAVSDVVSPKGAVGVHQIEPSTAILYKDPETGKPFDPARLHEPAYADKVGTAILKDLNEKFGADPRGKEAVAIGWNAGPGVARKWIKSGYDDSILPRETQDYVRRLRGAQAPRYTVGGNVSTAVEDLPPKVRQDAASTAIMQFGMDSPINVQPVIDKGLDEAYRTNPFAVRDEHDLEVSRLATEGMAQAVPERSSAFAGHERELGELDRTVQSMPATEPGAEVGPMVSEATEHMNNAITEAKALAPTIGEEAPAEFENKMGEAMEQMQNTNDWHKAVDAAVRCGVTRGVL